MPPAPRSGCPTRQRGGDRQGTACARDRPSWEPGPSPRAASPSVEGGTGLLFQFLFFLLHPEGAGRPGQVHCGHEDVLRSAGGRIVTLSSRPCQGVAVRERIEVKGGAGAGGDCLAGASGARCACPPARPLTGSEHLSALSPRPPCSSVLPTSLRGPKGLPIPGHTALAWLGAWLGGGVSVPGTHPSQGTCQSALQPPQPLVPVGPASCASCSRPRGLREAPAKPPVPVGAHEQVCWPRPRPFPLGPQRPALGS